MRSRIIDFLLGNKCCEETDQKDKELETLKIKLSVQKEVLMEKAGELCSTARKMHKKETETCHCNVSCQEEKKIV